MSYQNFIPTVWEEVIERELERIHVFAENTNRKYEGKVSQKGDSVRILGVGRPTITRTTDKNINLSDPETVEDTSAVMSIEQIAYFNYLVDDIDKRQAVGGVMEALSAETSEVLSDEIDRYIADLSKRSEAVKDSKAPVKITPDNVLSTINNGLKLLYKNDVKQSTKVTLTVSTDFYFILKDAYEKLDTDNSELMKNGRVGKYGNVIVKLSNNCASTDSGQLLQMKTDRAIAFCKPMSHTEAYRPEKRFSDAVKGFVLFDAKIVRPKEMINLNVTY